MSQAANGKRDLHRFRKYQLEAVAIALPPSLALTYEITPPDLDVTEGQRRIAFYGDWSRKSNFHA